jgi:spore maturation protein B
MEFAVPCVIGLIIIFGLIKKVPVFDTFLKGAKSGLISVYSIAPTMIGLIVAVSMLRASGALDFFGSLIAPAAQKVGISPEIIPFALLRPVSGGGSTALFSNIINENGPDSFVGRVASVMAGSTETTLYAVTVYFGSVGIKKIRHTLWVGLFADFTAFVFAHLTVRLFM